MSPEKRMWTPWLPGRLKRGHSDALVNNAGINIPRLLVDPAGKEELTEDVWDKVFAVNVKGQFLFAQAVARVFFSSPNLVC